MPPIHTKKLRQNLLLFGNQYLKLAIGFLSILFLIRIGEIFLYQDSHSLPEGWLTLLLISWKMDFILWLRALVPFFGIFVLLSLLSSRAQRLAFKILIVVFLTLELCLIFYYKSTLVLLGADFFSYSISDIIQTVGSSGNTTLIIAPLAFLFGILVIIYLNLINRKVRLELGLPVLSILFLLMAGTGYLLKGKSSYPDPTNDIVTNKMGHFIEASKDHFFAEIREPDIYADMYLMGSSFPIGGNVKFEYLKDPNFPFLHKTVDQDVLSPYFHMDSIRPNIVFIVVEGLGRAFSGEGAYLKSFTPFLDSLAQKSLYWKNTLSNTGRTFGVLPSLLGSLPFAKNGYMQLGNQMPEHISLLNLLKNNGYSSSFYYGGNASFDQMDLFLKLNKVDLVYDENSFPGTYTKLPSKGNFSWGYGDEELYSHYFGTKDDNSEKPNLDIILTISTHSPFSINEQSKYLEIFEKHLTDLKLTKEERDMYSNYADQYATVLYADDSLKGFFTQYEKKESFENTIFVITGDHRLPEIPMRNKIDRYHVPLLIYSPMLKKSSSISSISSHFDITPSLFTFLANRYSFEKPSVNSWLGHGLDTLRAFRNKQHIPLMQTKADFVDYVAGAYHLNNDLLYKMNADLEEELIENDTLKAQLQTLFDTFKRKNDYISQEKKMLPDSIISRYVH